MFGNKNTKKEIVSEKTNGKVLTGIVCSIKMTDTAVINVLNYHKHPRYNKFVKTRKKYKVHDKGNTLKVGDKIKIIETKPISKDKSFKLLEVITHSTAIDLSDSDDSEKEVTKEKK